jgi:ribose transport system ATP-binding protein
MPSLHISGLRKRFGETVALDGVDLEMTSGEVLAIVGENGAGKSTLMNIIAGVYPADAGRIQLANRRVSYIRQELSLFPHLSVAENVLIGMEPARWGFIQSQQMIERTRELLAAFGRPEISPDTRVRGLSPAARQVVEICRALASDARLILMDEPTSSLQRAGVERLFDAIRKLCERGISVIYVSHFLEEVREIANRIVVLRDGKTVWTGETTSVSDDDLITHMVGRPLTTDFRHAARAGAGETALEANDLEALPTVRHASFKLRRGEILGIAGLVGSGRTELVRAIFGLAPLSGGELKIFGETITNVTTSPRHSIRRGLGYLSEDRSIEGVIPHLSISDNITITRPRDRNAAKWIAKLKIRTADPSSSIRSLSGGNQQKALLARLLHQQADILLLDEPTRGIDIGSKAEIYEAIRGLAGDGKAILMVSSYLPELFEICDKLAVMSRGRLSDALPISDWTPETVLQAAVDA